MSRPSSQANPAGPDQTPNSPSVPLVLITFPMTQCNPMSLWLMPPAVITPQLVMTPIPSLPLQYLNPIIFQTPTIAGNEIWNVPITPQVAGHFQPTYSNMMNAPVQMQPASPPMSSNSEESALEDLSTTRYVFTKEQKAKMVEWFNKQSPYRMRKRDRLQLSEETGIPEEKILTWIQNYRKKLAKMGRKKQALQVTAPAQKQ